MGQNLFGVVFVVMAATVRDVVAPDIREIAELNRRLLANIKKALFATCRPDLQRGGALRWARKAITASINLLADIANDRSPAIAFRLDRNPEALRKCAKSALQDHHGVINARVIMLKRIAIYRG